MEAASRLEAEGGRQEEAVMINKCNLLKRKCMEYEEVRNGKGRKRVWSNYAQSQR